MVSSSADTERSLLTDPGDGACPPANSGSNLDSLNCSSGATLGVTTLDDEEWEFANHCPFDGRPYSQGEHRCASCGRLRPLVNPLLTRVSTTIKGPAITVPAAPPSSPLVSPHDIEKRRILYERNSAEEGGDTNVDPESFLHGLYFAKVPRIAYGTVVEYIALVLIEDICLEALLLCTFKSLRRQERNKLLYSRDGSFETLAAWSLAAVYSVCVVTTASSSRISVLVVGIGLLLSWAICPLIKVMTRDILEDDNGSHVFCAFLLVAGFVCFDHVGLFTSDWTGSRFALTFRTAATSVMASRLTRNSNVSALLFQGLLIFTLGPMVRRTLTKRRHKYIIVPFLIVASICGVAVSSDSPDFPNSLLAYAYATLLGSFTFLVPWLYVEARKKVKRCIRGPWDLSKVDLT